MGRPGETPVAGRVRQEEGRGAREDEHRARYRGGDSPRSRPGRPRTAAHGQLHYGPAAKASGSGARGQIAFGPDIAQGPAIISLLENADLSTFIHESGQFFLGVRSHTAGKSSFSVATANSPWRSAPHHGQLGALRRFNEATANSPWRWIESGRAPLSTAASMRPRRIRRGDRIVAGIALVGDAASMRPRRIRRGDRPSGPMGPDRPVLQGGHGEFAVEISSHRSRTRRCRRFNEATANSPWRCRVRRTRDPA